MTKEQLKTLTTLEEKIQKLNSAIEQCDNNIHQVKSNYTPNTSVIHSYVTGAFNTEQYLEALNTLKNQLIAIKAPLDAEFASFILSKPFKL